MPTKSVVLELSLKAGELVIALSTSQRRHHGQERAIQLC